MSMAMVEGGDDATGAGKRWKRWEARRVRRQQRNSRYYAQRKRRLKQTAFWGYDGFVEALIARRHALGWSQIELDERAGFQLGYTGKLEAWRGPQGRVAGSVTMTLWLEALGVGFVPIAKNDGQAASQAKALAVIERPKLLSVDHNRRIPTP